MLNESKCRCGRDIQHRYTLPAKEMELMVRSPVCQLTAMPKCGVGLCDRGSEIRAPYRVYHLRLRLYLYVPIIHPKEGDKEYLRNICT